MNLQNPSKTRVLEVLPHVLFLAIIFGYVLLRVSRLSITHDEALSYLNHVTRPVSDILLFKGAVPQSNHLLNTLLTKVFVSGFNVSEVTLRMPAILGCALYVMGIYKLTALCLTRGHQLPGRVVLIANPILLDFFSLGRGYALELGFMSIGLYYYLLAIRNMKQTAGTGHLIPAFCLLGLAVLSHFTFSPMMFSFAIVYPILLLAQDRCEPQPDSRGGLLKQLCQYLTITGIVFGGLTLIMYRPFVIMMAPKSIQGIVSGRILDSTVWSLIEIFLYYSGSNRLATLIFFLVMLAICSSGVLAGRDMILCKINRAEERCHAAVALLIIVCALVLIGLHEFFGVSYLIDRWAISFMPLVILLMLMVLDRLAAAGQRCLSLLGKGLIPALAFLFVAHFANTANASYSYFFRYDMSTKQAMKDLLETNRRARGRKTLKTIGADWIFLPGIAFYKLVYKMDWLSWPYRVEAADYFDYYYLTQPDSYAVKEFNLKKIPDQRTLQIIKHYSRSQTILAGPRH